MNGGLDAAKLAMISQGDFSSICCPVTHKSSCKECGPRFGCNAGRSVSIDAPWAVLKTVRLDNHTYRYLCATRTTSLRYGDSGLQDPKRAGLARLSTLCHRSAYNLIAHPKQSNSLQSSRPGCPTNSASTHNFNCRLQLPACPKVRCRSYNKFLGASMHSCAANTSIQHQCVPCHKGGLGTCPHSRLCNLLRGGQTAQGVGGCQSCKVACFAREAGGKA